MFVRPLSPSERRLTLFWIAVGFGSGAHLKYVPDYYVPKFFEVRWDRLLNRVRLALRVFVDSTFGAGFYDAAPPLFLGCRPHETCHRGFPPSYEQ